MVWGAFACHSVSKLVVLPKSVTVNKGIHLEIMCDHFEEYFELCKSEIFKQDGATCHIA